MANLHRAIIKYLGRTPDWIDEIQIQQDGDDLKIAYWNAPEPQLTDTELATLIAEVESKQSIYDQIQDLNIQIAKCVRLIDDSIRIRSDDTLRFSLVAKKKELIRQKNTLLETL